MVKEAVHMMEWKNSKAVLHTATLPILVARLKKTVHSESAAKYTREDFRGPAD